MEQTLVLVEAISAAILTFRVKRVILDSDLARLYGVTTARLNEQVKRNRERFPDDFMFQLSKDEYNILISQNATSSSGHGGRRKIPFAFTEYGTVMAASVLNSPKAVEVSVYITRAFVQQRAMLATNTELSLKLERLEKKLLAEIQVIHEHDDRLDAGEAKIDALIEAIRELRTPPESSRRPIGFHTDDEI